MRRTITIAEPIHLWIQQIRGWYLQEHGIELPYTGAINLCLAWGLCAATETPEEERKKFIDEVIGSEEIDTASIQDEFDNLWLARELPKIMKKMYDSYKNNPDNHKFPHFKGLMTTRYDHRSISFKESDGHFGMWANISTVNGKVKVPITSCPEYVEELKNNRFNSVQLKYRKGSFYLNVIFEENKQIPKEKNFQYFIGVDRGSHNNIAVAVVQNRNGDILESKFFPAKQMLEKRRRFLVLRQRLGRKKLLKEIKKSKDRERNYVKDVNHKISTEIIALASKYPNSVIVLEKLKGIRKHMNFGKMGNRKGHSWPFLLLEEMIVYKAHRNSIAVRRVYPRGTSSVCKNCFGNIVRSPSILAVCEACKKKYNADWLGAVNSTRRFFYYMSKNPGVSESRPKQGKDELGGSVIAPNPLMDLVHHGLMAHPMGI